ncbi:MAG: VanZ family protein [Pseudomonadota bacterium]
MENKYWAGLISVVWISSIGIVIYFSLIPNVEFPVDFWQVDKLYHFFSYSWLSVLPMIAYSNRKFALTASFSMILLGVLIEIGQLYVPGRTFSVADIVMNTIGVFFGIYGWGYLRRFISFV